jgi:hypothetical protein
MGFMAIGGGVMVKYQAPRSQWMGCREAIGDLSMVVLGMGDRDELCSIADTRFEKGNSIQIKFCFWLNLLACC